MKKTYFTEPTEMETVLINHPNDEFATTKESEQALNG